MEKGKIKIRHKKCGQIAFIDKKIRGGYNARKFLNHEEFFISDEDAKLWEILVPLREADKS